MFSKIQTGTNGGRDDYRTPIVREFSMPLFQSDTITAAVADILNDHFENSQNPHETIQKICTLLSPQPEPTAESESADTDRRTTKPQLRLVVR